MSTTKFAYSKFGLKANPRRAHVTLDWQGRTLLGEVTDCYRDETRGSIHLRVRHFNGEPWPIKPTALAVNVLVLHE